MIYGERIRLRAPERADIPTFAGWINDPEVRAGISLFLPMSLAREERWFEDMLQRPPEEQALTIEVKEGDGWTAIGNMGLFNMDPLVRSAEVGIMIGDKNYWNKGYGTEAMRLMLKHGFETLNLHRIFLRVFEDNPRAVRAYEKAGYVHEGRMRHATYSDGKHKDVLFMSVLREEWQAAQKE